MVKILSFRAYLLLVCLFMITLDSYNIFNIPIQWIGLSALTVLFLLSFNFKDIKISYLYVSFVGVLSIPIVFEILSNFSIVYQMNYQLRLINFVSFLIIISTINSFFKNINTQDFLNSLERLLILISLITIYIYFSQMFDFYEPFRNRSNTSFLGSVSNQTIFWPYEPHRAMGTFREPVLLVSYLFPIFMVLILGKKNLKIFPLLIISLALGLSRSDLLRIYSVIVIVIFISIKLYNKSKIFKKITPFLLVLVFSLISLKECALNSYSQECNTLNISNDVNIVSLENIENIIDIDPDRRNTINFLMSGAVDLYGNGLHAVNSNFQKYLISEIEIEMYLTNRVLPKYLNRQYSTQNFGTGNYSLLFFTSNVQSLFINLLIVFGVVSFFILFFLIFILFKNKPTTEVLKYLLILFFFFLIPIEELNAFTGLILGLGYRILFGDKNIEQHL